MSTPRRTFLGELSAELAGTAILILFGVGVVAQVVTGKLGDHDSIAWSWGIGVMLGIYVAGRISGAHLNPAVTLALAVFGGFEWRKVVPYALAQTLGAFLAALIVRWVYADAIASVDPHHTVATQTIFSTLPGNGDTALGVSFTTALTDQVVGTAILLFLIMAITDVRNSSPVAWFAPVAIAFVIVGIGMAWGTNAGYAINPARDFGPRLASYITGYGGAWGTKTGALYFWIPIVGPLAGGLIGAGAYRVLISRFLPEEETQGAQEVGEIPVPEQRAEEAATTKSA
ncbi:MAG: aquaporin family protein [Nocardioides sp.]|nr:aquaporin family protein [Nocardioides sp.]